jgi:inositol 3-alpha-galactosyltransferase
MFYPTKELWTSLLEFFNTSDRLKTYQFPDQDFLADFFRDRWQPVSWKYNAIKTMRYWHPAVWSDQVLVILHYIVDKPWERPVSEEGVAGHLGRDGETHKWWWEFYKDWHTKRSEDDRSRLVLDQVEKLVGTEKPFTKVVPLPEAPGRPEDAASPR